jgi:hypothetical protein
VDVTGIEPAGAACMHKPITAHIVDRLRIELSNPALHAHKVVEVTGIEPAYCELKARS